MKCRLYDVIIYRQQSDWDAKKQSKYCFANLNLGIIYEDEIRLNLDEIKSKQNETQENKQEETDQNNQQQDQNNPEIPTESQKEEENVEQNKVKDYVPHQQDEDIDNERNNSQPEIANTILSNSNSEEYRYDSQDKKSYEENGKYSDIIFITNNRI